MTNSFNQQALAGRTVLVTGASSGLGRAAAIAFAASGARVIVSGRDPGRLEATVASLPGSGHISEPTTLTDSDQAADWLKGVSIRRGTLSSVFHAAGTELVRPARLTKKAQIDELFQSSVMAAMGLARGAAQKGVLEDGGALLFMSSVAGQRGTAGMMAYSAAKAAIDGMVRSLACELAPRRIRVNALAAGAVETEMHERLANTLGPEGMADYEGRHLLGFGRPSDVADAAVFLICDASRWITGTTLVVDGGYLIR